MNAFNHYQQNQVLSASPEQILLMLYDGAVRFIRQAIQGLEEDKPAVFHHGIAKAVAIISEFSNSLDHKIGGDIAANLDALYSFMIRELIFANLHNDREKLKSVEGLLSDLRATWAEAIDSQADGKMATDQHETTSTAATEQLNEVDYGPTQNNTEIENERVVLKSPHCLLGVNAVRVIA